MSEQETALKRRMRLFPYEVERVERGDYEPIRGPIIGWPFPILNAILMFILRLRASSSAYYAPRKRRRTVIYEVVRDPAGRIAEIVEHETEVEE